MATQVSPGVSVTVTDESQYGSSGTGTIPLLVIATASNKIQPGSTSTIAPGTNPANASTMWLVTSQRDALQTFGSPVFYSVAGTPQFDNELNEVGLFTLYEYLGIANQAYVLRADLDLASLIPTTTAPTGPAISGQNWLNLSTTSWGVFRSNGNPNPAFSWQPKAPLVINSTANLEQVVQGYTSTPITSATSALINSPGTLSINNVAVTIAAGDSLSTVVSKINNNVVLQLQGVAASIFARTGKISPTGSTAGDIYNLRLVTSNTTFPTIVAGTTGVLNDLGLVTDQASYLIPAASFGTAGNFAVNTLADESGTFSNQLWEKITLATSYGSTDCWFQVGSTDSTYPGWGWREASPRILRGSVANPTLTATTTCTIAIGDGSPQTVTIPSPPTLQNFVNHLNTALENTAAVASVTAIGSQKYLTVTNYDGTSISITDLSDQDGNGTPWADAGVSATNTYWGTVTGTVSAPTFNAATLLATTATVAAEGVGYVVGDALTVTGGTLAVGGNHTILTVASLQAQLPNSPIAAAGSGYAPGDTITFFNGNYTVALIMLVDSIDDPMTGGITGLSITQPGQFTGVSAPTSGVAPTSTSGSGTGATVNLVWGVNTVNITQPGAYATWPTDVFSPSPVSVTGGAPSTPATFHLISGFLTSDSFSIDPGTGPQIVHVPATPYNTLAGVVEEINTVFANGPIVASVYNAGSASYLKIVNLNNTAFTVKDVHGMPLNDAGIAAGVTFARSLVYQGYSPSLTVPSIISQIAADNVWINTTPANQGANYVVQTYLNGNWIVQNITPNTGNIPMYSSDAYATAGFGATKAIGSIYARYNSNGDTPAIANHTLYRWNGTNWAQLVYTPSAVAPTGSPVDGTLWYNPALLVDIMVNTGMQWVGYRQVYPATDPNGVQVTSAMPTNQSTGANLVDYDLWLDSSNTSYPALYRYNLSSTTWVPVDNTDNINSSGIIFSDARPNADGTPTGSTVASALLLSDYVDPDAPNAQLYPAGMLLFNTRYSTNNVKIWNSNYFPNASWKGRWVTASGNRPDGSPYMGSSSQRIMIVEALKAQLVSSEAARAEQANFNLMATPGYIECLSNMIELNVDKKQTAFIVADTPAHLPPTGTAIVNWANNAANTFEDNEFGLISESPYAGLYYPWGLGTNLDGTEVFVPPSLMALRTLAYNDQVAYPWFAPAGFNRGLVTGVTSVGYLNAEGTYVPVTLNQGQRDVLYTNKINPISYISGRGLVVFGQKTLNPISSALDRINVVRLICDMNFKLNLLAQPFLFELNDTQTRTNVLAVFKSFMNNYKSLRAVYDYAVVCDTSNNTPTRIDLNQLWIDIAIQPEKAIEFIYIPIRVLNTGAPMPGGTTG